VYSRFPVHILYSFFLALALMVLLPVYFVRMRLMKKKPLSLFPRLGFPLPDRVPGRLSLWVHAVSVGEVISLQKLLQEIKSRHPDWALHVSVLTAAGMEVARQKLTMADRLFFAPFDFGWTVKRFVRRLEPGLLVLAESELWPNLLRQAGKRTRGVLVVNGRISERSFRRYKRLRPLAVRLFKNVSLYLVQTEQDRQRLIESGMSADRVRVAGNLKCDIMPPEVEADRLARLAGEISLPPGKKLLVAGSTREGEEQLLIEAFVEAGRSGAVSALILAPRHVDRVSEVERICRESGLRVERRTGVRTGRDWEVLILDTIGELAGFYALCDAAFIGGSLVPWGGHNLIEPAAYGKPIFFGPHMQNFAFLARAFLESGAARLVARREDLREMFLLSDPEDLKARGKRSLQTLKGLQGATERTLRTIESLAAGTSRSEGT